MKGDQKHYLMSESFIIYHPHLHCLMVFPKYIGIKKHRNSYSIDHTGKRKERLFTDEEILIQRIWYLLNNKIKVTKENIDNIAKIAPKKYKDGYSCQLDKFQENDFVELFTYMTKSTTEDDKPMRYGHLLCFTRKATNTRIWGFL